MSELVLYGIRRLAWQLLGAVLDIEMDQHDTEARNSLRWQLSGNTFRFAGMTFTIFDAVANINNRINSNNNNNNNSRILCYSHILSLSLIS